MVWGVIHLQYTSPPSIDPWHHDSSAVCSLYPETTCVATNATALMNHFTTRQSSASYDKDVRRLSPHFYCPSLAYRSLDFSPIEHIWDTLGWQIEHPRF
ncbi:hypothetical protein TNCV_4018831 [Trichonephila clavipes]|nr:hypothetical protein TNCV_4018831 [Trichonephila clavipes]